MFWGSGNPLSLFPRPEWLVLLPLAVLPVARELLRPVTFAAVAAGWEAGRHVGRRGFRFARWVVPALLAAGFVCAILAIAGPVRPVFEALNPPKRGHFWSVVLDCSGSMSIVDPGRSAARLRILADDLAQAVAARPQDRFAVVRVAGYADRMGPSSTSSRFLIDALKQISPALPGEDGTSLGDGLVLATEALPVASNRQARSILVVSDGRENPPEETSFRLADVVPELLESRIRVNWLRLDLPAEPDESPASRARGEASRQLLESLVIRSGGAVIDGEAGSDRTAIVEAAIEKFAGDAGEVSDWPSAATACLILALGWWIAAAVISVRAGVPKWNHSPGSLFRAAVSAAAFGGLIAAVMSAMSSSRTFAEASEPVTSRWLILLDASPSMSAGDAAEGSRLAAAGKMARGLIGRLSLEPGARAAIVRFSGRAVPESGWTDDWQGLEEIVNETRTDMIRPTGSDWDAALRAVSNAMSDDQAGNTNVATHVVFLTDGEPSREPADDITEVLAGRKWRLHFVTFGDDASPGATFPQQAGSNVPWMDKRTGNPARSARNDELAKRLAGLTDGKMIAAGSDDFEAWELALAIVGPVERMNFRSAGSQWRIGQFPMRMALLTVVCFLISECAGIIALSKRRIGVEFRWHSAVSVLVLLMQSCSRTERTADFETIAESAWSAASAGDLTRAEAILAFAAGREPNEPGFAYDIALIEAIRNRPGRARERLDEAEAKLERAVGIEPQLKLRLQARILAARGYVEMQAGNFDTAADWYSKAISSGGLTEAELADARINANRLEAISKNELDGHAREPEVSRSKPDPDSARGGAGKLQPVPDANAWNRMADEARGRAFAARSRFEPAGDEIKAGVRTVPGLSGTIDW